MDPIPGALDLIQQVNFVFSDKTGTLTENEMVFAHCCVGTPWNSWRNPSTSHAKTAENTKVCHENEDARDLGDFRMNPKLAEKEATS